MHKHCSLKGPLKCIIGIKCAVDLYLFIIFIKTKILMERTKITKLIKITMFDISDSYMAKILIKNIVFLHYKIITEM